jgi:hypothetical protein
VIQALHLAYVRLPSNNWVAPKVEIGDRKVRAFTGCISAVDSTSLRVFVPTHNRKRLRSGRKGVLTQKVFAAVKFNGSFSYVFTGGKGTIRNTQLYSLAFRNGFQVPKGRYYLTDVRFSGQKELIIPFQDCRDHLQDWRDSKRPPRTAKKVYNLRHSRLQVTVKQIYGTLKRRWKIIRDSAPKYSVAD